ncbi:conserved hypothetical protein [Hyella patelloides LEGE 07179]|uniref:HTH crp-type domain-containing protein n=1 Tax=Hyella patelloides LEGE 07179 TaxID=945734 RepID=A0A563VZQ6_9CYAN|nr:Crp/Fnr family transcriptional regulator [Hyella patelloides]VEP16900.1 conserved hypothetical protein [Hyella patelloides LEGE 07179]
MVLSIPHPPNAENKEPSYRANYLLSLLSESDFNSLIANSNRIFLPSKTVLHQPNEPIQKVYFPLRGIISLVSASQEGLIAELATVSNKGMVGIAAFLGGSFLSSFAVVQTDCIAITLNADILRHEFARGGELQKILLLYTQALFSQTSQNVFCSCHHTIEQRLARWLLSFSDRLEQRKLLLTQETLADLLGVRRSSLSVVANKFRQRNLIDYSRGRIMIQNPVALRKVACECEQIIAAEYFRLMNVSQNY